jgi:MFS family permease
LTTDVARPQGRTRPWLAFAVVLAAAFMDLVDGTIVSIALPQIQADLRADYATAQWILVGYSVTFALALIPGGRLGDIYGRRRVFLLGVAAFTVASIACGAATTAPVLVVARLLQGVAAGLMVPQVMSVVVILFQHAERAKALALYGVTLSLANVSGPLLGAVFTEYSVLDLGWRAIFYVNVPIGVLALLGALRWMPESRSQTALRVDVAGIVLVSLASFALMFPVIQGRETGWPIGMIVLLIAAGPLLWAFGMVERRRDRRDGSALVPPGLLGQRSFVVGLIVLLIVFSTLASLFLVLNYTLLTGYGWSPLRTALTGIGFPVGVLVRHHHGPPAHPDRAGRDGRGHGPADPHVPEPRHERHLVAARRADPGDGSRHGPVRLHSDDRDPGRCTGRQRRSRLRRDQRRAATGRRRGHRRRRRHLLLADRVRERCRRRRNDAVVQRGRHRARRPAHPISAPCGSVTRR